MSKENTILIFHQDKDLIDATIKIARELKLTLYLADKFEDLIAVPYFFALVNPLLLVEADLKNLEYFYSNENVKEISFLFTVKPDFKIPQKIKKLIINTPDYVDYNYLKIKILSLKSTIKRHKNGAGSYDKKLSRLFYIIRKSECKNSVLFLNELCNEFNVSEKTIKRDIALINSIGDEIVFDKLKKGYVMKFSLRNFELTEL